MHKSFILIISEKNNISEKVVSNYSFLSHAAFILFGDRLQPTIIQIDFQDLTMSKRLCLGFNLTKLLVIFVALGMYILEIRLIIV